MSLASSVLKLQSARRFAVEHAPDNLDQTGTLGIRRYSWRPIDDARGERESFGWVNPRRVLDTDLRFENLVVHPWILLGVRLDRKDISNVLFRARCEEKIARVAAAKNLAKLPRAQRIAIEEDILVAMLRETSPRSTFANAVWDRAAAILYVGATGKLCDRIVEIFEATFSLQTTPIIPANLIPESPRES